LTGIRFFQGPVLTSYTVDTNKTTYTQEWWCKNHFRSSHHLLVSCHATVPVYCAFLKIAKQSISLLSRTCWLVEMKESIMCYVPSSKVPRGDNFIWSKFPDDPAVMVIEPGFWYQFAIHTIYCQEGSIKLMQYNINQAICESRCNHSHLFM